MELQRTEGRRRLIEGLKAIGRAPARANRFIFFTGLRRRAAAGLTQVHLIASSIVEFKNKTRTVRIQFIETGHGVD